eukprot:1193455-Prorocentrum_minimum.AAC.1
MFLDTSPKGYSLACPPLALQTSGTNRLQTAGPPPDPLRTPSGPPPVSLSGPLRCVLCLQARPARRVSLTLIAAEHSSRVPRTNRVVRLGGFDVGVPRSEKVPCPEYLRPSTKSARCLNVALVIRRYLNVALVIRRLPE